MKDVLVLCSHCAGTGKVLLSHPLLDTLAVVSKTWQSTQQIADATKDPYVQATAINNRLVTLETLGLVQREQRGRSLYWKLNNSKTK